MSTVLGISCKSGNVRDKWSCPDKDYILVVRKKQWLTTEQANFNIYLKMILLKKRDWGRFGIKSDNTNRIHEEVNIVWIWGIRKNTPGIKTKSLWSKTTKIMKLSFCLHPYSVLWSLKPPQARPPCLWNFLRRGFTILWSKTTKS